MFLADLDRIESRVNGCPGPRHPETALQSTVERLRSHVALRVAPSAAAAAIAQHMGPASQGGVETQPGECVLHDVNFFSFFLLWTL